MANPYPPNQGMPGMQQPTQQQMQQMGQMPPHQIQQPPRGANVTRPGTSRAVPVVVSAGLAVGVFCGLLFGVGIPDEATASPSTGNNVQAADPTETTPTPTSSSSTATTPATAAPTSTTPATATKPATATADTTSPPAGSATPATAAPATVTPATATPATATPATAAPAIAAPATGTPATATPTVAAAPAPKKVKLFVEIKPDSVAETAKITVDKKEIAGGMTELELPGDGKKEVKVVVKASGYRTVEQKVEVEGDVTVKVELIKRTGGGGSSTPGRPPTGGGSKGGKKPPGGLIDI